jgi:hypothetical protein
MAIKKRAPQTDAEREAAIAAFGDGADAAPQTAAPEPGGAAEPAAARARSAAPRTTRPAKATSTDADVPTTSLIRWGNDEDLPRAIQQIAASEDRSFHKTILQLLRRGVDDYNASR